MKKQKQNSMLKQYEMIYKLFLMVLFVFSICFTKAQQLISIDLPQSNLGSAGGTMVCDIIYANGKMFVYSSDKILVYNAYNHTYSGCIDLSQYGKFNPAYFNPRLHVNDINIMAVNNDGQKEILYAITPNLHIKAININNISETWDITPYVDETQTLEDLFQTQNGRVIIKYDNNNNRLFLLISGKNLDENCTGHFHVRTSFFGIYDIDNDLPPNDDNYINLYYSEIIDEDDHYTDQINDFVFNTVPDKNYYYLTRLGEPYNITVGTIEVWEITPDVLGQKVKIISTIHIITYADNYYKLGKMLYVNNSTLHKIIVFPYRYPSTGVTNPKFCVIDGNHSNDPASIQYDIIDSPSKRILDAIFLEESNDLILSYAPDNNEIPVTSNHGTDIAVFNYDGSTFVPKTPFSYSTDNSINTSDDYDINSSLKLLKVNSNTALISKKDEIVKLHYNGTGYTFDLRLAGEGNFFMNGASGSVNSFIINTVANGIEVFDNINFYHPPSIHTGYPVYHITANIDGSKLYFYNKLNSYNTGLYVYGNGPVVNINDQQSIPEEGIETAIGDCIYNPYTDHFLVSENNETAKIKVFDTDPNNSWNSTISLPANTQFPKKMFIAPNEKLYVIANMHKGLDPKICIYNANDYTFIQAFDVTDLPNNDDEFEYYSAHFCYNHYNQKVYATIHPTEINLNPYNTVPNSMFEYPSQNQDSNNIGLMIRFDDNQINTYKLIYPGKIICPDNGNPEITSQYDGKMFIIGKEFYVYNFFTDAFDPANGYIQPFNDITYSAFHDQLFSIRDVEDECSSDRKCEIYSIDCENSNIAFNQLGYNIDGQAASIFSNPYDGKVYIYNKFDDEKLGGTEAKLFYFDPSVTSSLDLINLGITSYYPELDHCGDYFYHFYNITTPYINPYTNHIYLPNGGHSCISKVPFNEPLLLRSGWTWLSFPRLEERDPNGNVDAIEVLDGNIQPDFTYAYMEHLEVDQTGSQLISIEKIGNDPWNTSGYLEYVNSLKGYKLKLDDPEERTISLFGTVLDPSTQMDLYTGYANWIGFFPIQTMTVSEAFASIWDNISEIRHQDWAIANPSGNQPPPVPDYMLNYTLSYGDMVTVKVFEDCTFQWPSNADPETPLSAPETQYFTYEEKADYTPFYVEMNPDSIPVEIAVYEDTTCIGASVVQDSLVEINGYLTDSAGYNPEISFVSHYASRSAPKEIRKYHVYNFEKGKMERRTIRSKDKADYYWISLKGGTAHEDEEIETSGDIEFKVYPNPFSNQTHFTYELKKPAKVGLYIYDTKGMRVTTLIDGSQTSGIYKLTWNGKKDSGRTLQPGIYYYKFLANGLSKNGKLVFIE